MVHKICEYERNIYTFVNKFGDTSLSNLKQVSINRIDRMY